MTERIDTNPRPCGICRDSCGYTGPDGNGHHQCEVFGRLWSDNDPTGPSFVAHLLSVDRGTVDKWRTRGVMPEPSWPVEETGRPLWRRRTILDWAKATGRL